MGRRFAVTTNKMEILTTDLEGSTTALFRSCWFACTLTLSENTQDFKDSLLGKLENSDDGNKATGRLPIQTELVNDPPLPLLDEILSFVCSIVNVLTVSSVSGPPDEDLNAFGNNFRS